VVCCVWTGVREGGNKLRDLRLDPGVVESSRVESSYESAWLAGYEELCAIMKLIYITGLCVATWTSFPTAARVCLLASVD
jgi:hypothetical protein